MSGLASAEQTWMKGYYGQAVGLTITKFEIATEDDFGYLGVSEIVTEDDFGYTEFWPRFTAVDKNGNEFILEISRDPEGNGPGFIFGLPDFSVADN